MEKIDKSRENVESMFDSIAHKYDFLNHFLSVGIDRSWRKYTIKKIKALKPNSILDIATGTADLAIMAAKNINNVKIIGVDISAGMLEVGRKKIESQNLENCITLAQGDALELNLPSSSFDVAMVAFGVRNFSNLDSGLKEINRILKPGATLFVLELGMPPKKIIGNLYRFYFTKLLPLVGRLTSKNRFAYKYLPMTVADFPSGEKFVEHLTNCGYKHSETKRFLSGVAYMYSAVKI